MSRVDNIQKKLKEKQIDALLITSNYNLEYASGFTGTTGLSVITEDKAFFVTDFRYTEQAAKQAEGFEIIQNIGSIYDEVAKIIKNEKISRLGFEENHVTYATYQSVKELFNCSLVPVSTLIEELREIKDRNEIDLIQKAISITEAAFEHILSNIKPGMSEIKVANELDFFMREKGASGVSFDTIVASGVRSAMPHGVASDKLIETGDMITIDFGCYYKGYVSDMTRTFALGDPGEKLKRIHQIVLEANQKVTEAAKAGVTGAYLDSIARNYITEQGYGDAFGHSTGHGIGLEVHEGPGINFKNNQPLVVGNVITNEPGIYIPGLGGVRIEDDLLITEEGNRNLMQSSKELIIL
ncbi:Xaa-Pro aminopeptidase [Marinilactibacillus psychrotolerans]|uniref:M24 family metallopeptidase n=1 Tax=Marinilactibacillus psychrotolerans TaxID=191770 RepID=UPI001C7D72B1|nr:Xaa-Pro peptidase family protein [Marinilactibacillus psychrotolerans]GEQ32139.1 Xaa-Pro aminopeptidase [Marinilactibacillus psychrotolerans]